jgi:hypothetical protein
MSERSLLIHFDTKTGHHTVEAEGFEGLSCLEATGAFEEALGVVSESDRTFKPEAQTNSVSTTNSVQARQRQ